MEGCHCSRFSPSGVRNLAEPDIAMTGHVSICVFSFVQNAGHIHTECSGFSGILLTLESVTDTDVPHRNWQVGGDPARASRPDFGSGCCKDDPKSSLQSEHGSMDELFDSFSIPGRIIDSCEDVDHRAEEVVYSIDTRPGGLVFVIFFRNWVQPARDLALTWQPDRDGQTDRRTDRQTGGQTDGRTDRQTDTETVGHAMGFTGKVFSGGCHRTLLHSPASRTNRREASGQESFRPDTLGKQASKQASKGRWTTWSPAREVSEKRGATPLVLTEQG